MKPPQIVLLVAAGAVGGALLLKVAQGPAPPAQPVPPVPVESENATPPLPAPGPGGTAP